MLITVELLKHTRACDGQVEALGTVFPAGVDTAAPEFPALCAEHASTFDFGWASLNLLPTSLRAEYERQHASIFATLAATV